MTACVMSCRPASCSSCSTLLKNTMRPSSMNTTWVARPLSSLRMWLVMNTSLSFSLRILSLRISAASGSRFAVVARYVVVRHHAVTAVLNHDAELVGPEHASLHGQPRDSETVYAAVVDARRPPRVAQEQPREGHAVGPDLYDVAFPAAVDYGQAHSPPPHAAPHHQVLAVYGAGMDEDVVAVARGGERAANCRVGLAPPHVELAPSGGEREEQQQERQWDEVHGFQRVRWSFLGATV